MEAMSRPQEICMHSCTIYTYTESQCNTISCLASHLVIITVNVCSLPKCFLPIFARCAFIVVADDTPLVHSATKASEGFLMIKIAGPQGGPCCVQTPSVNDILVNYINLFYRQLMTCVYI